MESQSELCNASFSLWWSCRGAEYTIPGSPTGNRWLLRGLGVNTLFLEDHWNKKKLYKAKTKEAIVLCIDVIPCFRPFMLSTSVAPRGNYSWGPIYTKRAQTLFIAPKWFAPKSSVDGVVFCWLFASELGPTKGFTNILLDQSNFENSTPYSLHVLYPPYKPLRLC